MEVNFVKTNPAGNTTVIVLDQLPRSVYGEIAEQIMSPQGLGAEQVGFAERPQGSMCAGRLHMMGGEFCGNASRAFGAWLSFRGYPGITWRGETSLVPIEVSGHDEVLTVEVLSEPDGLPVWASSPMPVPHRISFIGFRENQIALVDFPGISHAVVWDKKATSEMFREVATICEAESAPAFGVMFFDEPDGEIVPLVSVQESRSLVWEGSCASGSVAVASALAARDRRSHQNVRLKQPRGELMVCVDWDGKVVSAQVSGPVEVVAVGTAWVDL